MMASFRVPAAVRGAVPVIGLFAIWGVGAQAGWISPAILPPLPQVLQGLADPQISDPLFGGLAASARRLVLGGALGIAAGLALGGALGLSQTVDKLVGPSFHAFRQVDLFAWIPLLTAWLGGGELAKVVFVALAAFKPAAMGTYEGFRNVPAQYVDVGRALCFSPSLTLRRIVLPAALPSVVGGLQLSLIYGWLATIGAEYLMGGIAEGLGAFVVAAREHMALDQVYLGVLVVAVVGLALNKGLRRLGDRALRWQGDPG
jgi:sulfonate transport system permease protein